MNELAQDEARHSAREYLAAEAFIAKKHREMIKPGRYVSQGGEHVVNEMTDEEVIYALDEESGQLRACVRSIVWCSNRLF